MSDIFNVKTYKYKSERLSWSLRSDVEFYKELLHEYTIREKAYGKKWN